MAERRWIPDDLKSYPWKEDMSWLIPSHRVGCLDFFAVDITATSA